MGKITAQGGAASKGRHGSAGLWTFLQGVSERIAVNFLLSGILKCQSVSRLTSWMLELLVGVTVYMCNFESVAYREEKNIGFISRLRNSSS